MIVNISFVITANLTKMKSHTLIFQSNKVLTLNIFIQISIVDVRDKYSIIRNFYYFRYQYFNFHILSGFN